jgi:hypothetical protein
MSPEVEAPRAFHVPKYLTNPHPLIAAWISEDKRRADSQFTKPPRRSSLELRRLRIMNALLRHFESRGAIASTPRNRTDFTFTFDGEKVHVQCREKLRQVKRSLTADELRWKWYSERGYVLEHEGTGFLVFTITNYVRAKYRKTWLENEQTPLEFHLPAIISAIELTARVEKEHRLEREQEEAKWRAQEELRQQERMRQELDRTRWRQFVDMARRQQEVTLVRQFISELEKLPCGIELYDGKTAAEWLQWARVSLLKIDYLSRGANFVFEHLANSHLLGQHSE